MGHNGGGHKKHPSMSGRAQRLTACGFHVAVIDAPGHGDRPRTAHDEQDIAELRKAQATGTQGPVVVRYNARLAELAVPEWQATLDALQELPEIGTDGPVGYFGLTLGTAIGVPLVAAEPRITAAVFGLMWPDAVAEAAQQITVPVEYDIQWDDEIIPREAYRAVRRLRLEGEDAARQRGQALRLPRFEADSAVRFFARHLGRTANSPANSPA